MKSRQLQLLGPGHTSKREYMRRPAQLRQMSEIEAAYVGAMIDAEGGYYSQYHRTGYPERRVSMTNTDLEIISAILRATGTGRVGMHYPAGGRGNRACWTWAAGAINDVIAIAERCAPYSTKAQRFLEEAR